MLNADDRWAIAETLSLHGHLFDGGHLDRLGEIFTPDVVYDMSGVGLGVFEGVETVLGAARKMADSGVGPVAHHVTNVVIVSDDGDAAVTESKIFMIMTDGSVESSSQRDTLRRNGGRWRISHRVLTAGKR